MPLFFRILAKKKKKLARNKKKKMERQRKKKKQWQRQKKDLKKSPLSLYWW